MAACRATRSTAQGPRRDLMALGVDAPIIDVRGTVETAAWVRPGAGVPAQRSSASGQQHRQPNDDQRDPMHREPTSLWGSSSPTPPADTISSPGTGPQRRQRLRLGFSTVAVPPFANALAAGSSYRFVELAFFHLDARNDAEIAVVDVLVVIVLDLHDLVARAEGPAEAFDADLARGVECILKLDIEGASTEAAAVHR